LLSLSADHSTTNLIDQELSDRAGRRRLEPDSQQAADERPGR
jgi:hypothetical protein